MEEAKIPKSKRLGSHLRGVKLSSKYSKKLPGRLRMWQNWLLDWEERTKDTMEAQALQTHIGVPTIQKCIQIFEPDN